ncbi:MAG: NAD(P)H-dependent oxidoreductase [Bacteroidetes bacterium]|nr:NAD(P)H-dependent oxidoreductase [Bacteroidota bacterium]
MKQLKIAVIVGSLRKESFNRKMAVALTENAPEQLSFEFLEIGNLDLYSEDLDATPPQAWVEFRNKVKSFDGVLFVTPEYNRSFPGVLKNAIDVASRPWGQSVWGGKPAAIVSVTIGGLGAFGASNHLRQVLAFLGMPTMTQPEAYIGNATSLFDDNGRLNNDSTLDFVKSYMKAFAQWVETFVK